MLVICLLMGFFMGFEFIIEGFPSILNLYKFDGLMGLTYGKHTEVP